MSSYEEMLACEETLVYLAQQNYVAKHMPARYAKLVKDLEACNANNSKVPYNRECIRIFESEIERAAYHRT